MKKIISTISNLFLILISFFGLAIGGSSADVQHKAGLTSIKENTPLYLETASTMLQKNGQANVLLADDDSHYSHESHDSHYSHESHQSHYSGYGE
jgi:hypothetical protein